MNIWLVPGMCTTQRCASRWDLNPLPSWSTSEKIFNCPKNIQNLYGHWWRQHSVLLWLLARSDFPSGCQDQVHVSSDQERVLEEKTCWLKSSGLNIQSCLKDRNSPKSTELPPSIIQMLYKRKEWSSRLYFC